MKCETLFYRCVAIAVVSWAVGCVLPPLPLPDAGVCGCLPRPASCEGEPLHPICEFADAGRDVGPPDTSFDAPYRRDAPLVDAPWGEDDPGWVYLSGLPETCDVQVATYPERIATPDVWVADCGTGCLRREGGFARFAGELDGVPIFVSSAGLDDDESAFENWVFTEALTGRAVAAFRDTRNASTTGSPSCAVAGWGAGAGAVVVGVAYFDYDETGSIVEDEWMSVLRLELSTREIRSMHRGGTWPANLGTMRVSATHVGFLLGGRSPVLLGADGAYRLPNAGRADVREVGNLALVRGSDLFWEAQRAPAMLLRSVGGAPPVLGWEVRGGDVRGFSTDGTDFAWLEARGWDEVASRYASVSLWAATYDGIGLVGAHRVVDVLGHDDGVVGGGYYAHLEPDPEDGEHPVVAFYRIADGGRATTDVASYPSARVMWISAEAALIDGRFWIDPRTLTFE